MEIIPLTKKKRDEKCVKIKPLSLPNRIRLLARKMRATQRRRRCRGRARAEYLARRDRAQSHPTLETTSRLDWG